MIRGIAENMVAVVNTALKGFSDMQLVLLTGKNAKVSCEIYVSMLHMVIQRNSLW